MKKLFIGFLFLIFYCNIFSQQHHYPKGNLFIIGGGTRTPELMQSLLQTAQLSKKDYAVVLPMSSEEGDSAYYYFKDDFDKLCNNTIANLNFTKEDVNNKAWLDSIVHAKLIFITGGDQSRFMKIVLNTPVYKAVHEAYNNGATIGGTSAGAAVMCKHMITGNQLQDTIYESTFDKLITKNIEFADGLGLVDSVIIDQHFIRRSRYNRLLSALYDFPKFSCIGINESTAIIIHANTIKVTGKSQVMVLDKPVGLTSKKNYIKLQDLHLAIYTDGDTFKFNQ